MTLNAVTAFILRFFSPNSTDFEADYMTVVEDRPIMSVKYCLPVPLLAKTITHPVQRGLSAIAEHLVLLYSYSTGCWEAVHDENFYWQSRVSVTVSDVLKYLAADATNE